MNTIPFLPKSIAVGLQDNLVQYINELKFLLLFFDKPLAIFSNDALCFIDNELSLLKQKNKYNWLKKISSRAYGEIKESKKMAVWSLLSNPLAAIKLSR